MMTHLTRSHPAAPDISTSSAGRGLLLERGHHVGVGVHGQGDGAVPDELHDHPRVVALGEEQGGEGMAEVVEADSGVGRSGPEADRRSW